MTPRRPSPATSRRRRVRPVRLLGTVATAALLVLVGGAVPSHSDMSDRATVPPPDTVRAEPGVVSFVPGQPVLPRYDRVLRLEMTSETSANISFGDLDGDGHLDIVLAKGRHWPLVDRVLLGDGRGGIREAYDLGTASDKTYSGHLVDLDGDGDLDVVISNDTPDPKLVYLNDGRGRFTPGTTFGRPEWPTRNATIADMNGDGLPDIIVANRYGRGPGSNFICLNRGGGRFDSTCVAFAPEPATTITAADFTGDGVPDLLVPHRNGGQSQLYVGAHGGALDRMTRIPFGDPITLGDTSVVPYALVAGDLNGDGHPDLVVGFVRAAPIAYLNDGTGRRFTPVSFGDAAGAAYGIAIADFDADGVPDIGVARSDAPNVLYFGALPSGGSSRR
jgi:hypothetical protein